MNQKSVIYTHIISRFADRVCVCMYALGPCLCVATHRDHTHKQDTVIRGRCIGREKDSRGMIENLVRSQNDRLLLYCYYYIPLYCYLDVKLCSKHV